MAHPQTDSLLHHVRSLAGEAVLIVRSVAVLVLALGVPGLGAGLLLTTQDAAARREPPPAPRQPEPVAQREAHADVHGDPLPAGAVARLGTLRWRQAAQSFAFSPDGRYLAAAGKTTRLFDARSGKLLRTIPEEAYYVHFPPDRKTLVTAPIGYFPVLRCWDLATGAERRQIPVAGGGSFYPSWSADGKVMACYSFQDKTGPVVSFWDMDSGKEIRSWVRPLGSASASQLALAPDGKTVALREQSNVHLFEVTSGKELRRLDSPRGNAGSTLATRLIDFSPDSKLLACTEQGNVRVWETATGKSAHHFAVPENQAVAVAFSPDGRCVAAGGGQGAVYLCDLMSGKLTHTLPASRVRMPVYLLAFSPDGKRLATQDHALQSIHLWDVATGREVAQPEAPATQVEGLAFSPDGKQVVSASADGGVWVWDAATGALRRRYQGNSTLGFNMAAPVAVLPGGTTLVCGGYESDVVTWDLLTGRRLHAGKAVGAMPGPERFRGADLYPDCSPDGSTVVAVFPGAEKRRIEPHAGGRPPPPPTVVHWTMVGLWDARAGRMTRSFRVDAEHLRHMVLSPDGRRLAGVGRLPDDLEKTFAFVWDLARGRELRRLEIPALEGWNRIAFSADGRTLISGAHNPEPGRINRLYFWEVATGRRRAAVACELETRSAPLTAFAGDRLAALVTEAKVHLVDPLTGKELKRLEGHEGWIDRLAFSPDGKRLATGSRDTTALVWDLTAVIPAEAKVRLSAKELAERWAEVGGDEGERAYGAIRVLARAPEQAVALIGDQVRPVPFPQREAVQRLLAALDSKQFAEREKAADELHRLGEVAEAALRQVLDGEPSLEVRRRVEGILGKMKEAEAKPPPVPTGEALRAVRALEVLERVGTPEAERLLRRLADGAPHAPFTGEARASWERLTRGATR